MDKEQEEEEGEEEEAGERGGAARCDYDLFRSSAPPQRLGGVASAASVGRASAGGIVPAGGLSRRGAARAAAARSYYFDAEDDDPFIALGGATGGGAGRSVMNARSELGGGAWRTVQRMRPGSDGAAAHAGACSNARACPSGGRAGPWRGGISGLRRPADGKENSGRRKTGKCGTPNCNLRDFHCGPCEPELALSGRKRSRRPSSFRDWGASDEEPLSGRDGSLFGAMRIMAAAGGGSLGGGAGRAGKGGRCPNGEQAGRALRGGAQGGGTGKRSLESSGRGGGARAGGEVAGPWGDAGRRLGGGAGPEPRGRHSLPTRRHDTSERASSSGAGRGGVSGSRPTHVDLVSPPSKLDSQAEWLCPQCGLHNGAAKRECDACGGRRPAVTRAFAGAGEARCFDGSPLFAVPGAGGPSNADASARPRLMRLKKRAIRDSDEEEAASPAYDVDAEY
jgi:hypothetical protein